MKIKNAWITIHAEEPSLIRYSKVKIKGNELHFYLKNEIIFIAWLDRDDYTNLIEAGKSIKINICNEKNKHEKEN
jgi:hypothetical protein